MKMKIKYYMPIVNWNDNQCRIYKNAPHIKWERKVHEIIVGAKTYGYLPQDVEMAEHVAIIHHKTIDRQVQQNEKYANILGD